MKKSKALKDDLDFNYFENWPLKIQGLIEERSKSIQFDFPEIKRSEIKNELFAWVRGGIYISFGNEHKDRNLQAHNTWHQIDSALQLGFNLKSITLNLRKGHAKEKIELEFDPDSENLHTKIYSAIMSTHKKIKPKLRKAKITNLGSSLVYPIKNLSRIFPGEEVSRATEIKRLLGNKERVYGYFESVITSANEILGTYNTLEIPTVRSIDLNKALRNHLGKF